MIKVGSVTDGLENHYYRNKSELVDNLMTYGDCYFDYDNEEDEIAKEEGYKDIREKLLSMKTKELVELFEIQRG